MKEEYKQTLRKIFRIMDTSGDGKIDAEELKNGFDKIFDKKDYVTEAKA